MKVEFSIQPHEQSDGEVDGKLGAWVYNSTLNDSGLLRVILKAFHQIEDKLAGDHGHGKDGHLGDCFIDGATLCKKCVDYGRAVDLTLIKHSAGSDGGSGDGETAAESGKPDDQEEKEEQGDEMEQYEEAKEQAEVSKQKEEQGEEAEEKAEAQSKKGKQEEKNEEDDDKQELKIQKGKKRNSGGGRGADQAAD